MSWNRLVLGTDHFAGDVILRLLDEVGLWYLCFRSRESFVDKSCKRARVEVPGLFE